MLVAVLAFAACGDDSSSSDETASAPTEVATEAPTEAATEAPTEAPTEDAPATDPTKVTKGDAGVKVTGELGSVSKIEVPKDGKAPTSLLIKDIKKGTGPKATAGQNVSVQYSGVLLKDGSKFDASWDRGGQPFEFALGQGKELYYHGYAYEGESFYDYKKRFSALEEFDWEGNWVHF